MYNVTGNGERANIDGVREVCCIVAEETDCAQAGPETLITFVADRPGLDLRYAIDGSKLKRECGREPRRVLSLVLARRCSSTWTTASRPKQARSAKYRKWMKQNYENRRA